MLLYISKTTSDSISYMLKYVFTYLMILGKQRGSQGQDSYSSWKTWKVVKFKNFIFQGWKVMEN